MTKSDIKLENQWIIGEGNYFRCRTLDFMLDSPARRKNNNGHRRALVHNPADGLTINYAGDYPDGVTIKGTVQLDRHVHMATNVVGFKAWDLMLDGGTHRRNGSTTPYRRALVHGHDDTLCLNWNRDYTNGVKVRSDLRVEGELHGDDGIYVNNGLWVKLEEDETDETGTGGTTTKATVKTTTTAERLRTYRISPIAISGLRTFADVDRRVVTKVETRAEALRSLLDEVNIEAETQGDRAGRVNLIELVATLAEKVQALEAEVEELKKPGNKP